MSTTNTIVLRPRFKIELERDNESALKDFEDAKASQNNYIVNRIDDHVFIKFPKHRQHFWSPQLHLEINEIDKKSSLLYGLFGPNPTVWTLFMFLHFMVAGLFIAFSIWAYTNWCLKSSYAIQVCLMFFMVIVWFVLYFAGSIGKASSKNEMLELQQFMNEILKID
ncbi:GTP-binding protein [Yeosuana marina]|uniref:GTP-binding protein n=1 Tax=Yeosuana marina TaxID=1565536 RepID=UPI0030ED8E66|tara:strand:- start:2074 stop:2571 length:498 start_codon:yes stop_codon:yes gene_type:complete